MRQPFVAAAPSHRLTDVQGMWSARKSGLRVTCAYCKQARVALSIEGPRSYQWACQSCGERSPLFFVVKDLVRLHMRPLGEPERDLAAEKGT